MLPRAHLQGEKAIGEMHILRGDAYTKGEKTFFFRKPCFVLFYYMLVFSLFYGTLSYIQYLCFVAFITSCLCVGHAIDFCVSLNCIACSNDHLLAKCSLQSFFYDYSCLIKICLIVYILFITLIALYLLIYVPCIQLVISLIKVLFVCECFRLQVYTCKCFTTFRLGVNEFCHCSQTHV